MKALDKPASNDNPPQAGEGRFGLQFRVLVIAGARKAFRLETPFWRALEVLARRSGRSLPDEVEARLAAAPAEMNQASALRASLAGELFDLWNDAVAKAVRPQWTSVVAALPAPAFVISRRSVLLAANEPLLSYLQAQRPGRDVPLNTLAGALNLSVETPPSAVTELNAAGDRRFVTCNVMFKTPTQKIGCRVRLVPIEGASAEIPALLGFVDTTRA